jgi:psiF repeat
LRQRKEKRDRITRACRRGHMRMRCRLAAASRSVLQSPPRALRKPRGEPMKNLMTVLALSVAALSSPVFAADPPMTKQQNKMGQCNADAGDKKGDERKAFMKECLSAKKMTQQDKMKSCNADAAGKKGDERKAFMKECLSA